MKKKLFKTLLFVMVLIALQQGIAFGNSQFEPLGKQTAIIRIKDIDPSALFYMESKLALGAERAIRKKLH